MHPRGHGKVKIHGYNRSNQRAQNTRLRYLRSGGDLSRNGHLRTPAFVVGQKGRPTHPLPELDAFRTACRSFSAPPGGPIHTNDQRISRPPGALRSKNPCDLALSCWTLTHKKSGKTVVNPLQWDKKELKSLKGFPNGIHLSNGCNQINIVTGILSCTGHKNPVVILTYFGTNGPFLLTDFRPLLFCMHGNSKNRHALQGEINNRRASSFNGRVPFPISRKNQAETVFLVGVGEGRISCLLLFSSRIGRCLICNSRCLISSRNRWYSSWPNRSTSNGIGSWWRADRSNWKND